MPIFLQPVAPFILNNEAFGFAGGAGTTAAVAGSAILCSAIVRAPITLTQMRMVFSGAVTGNVDMGIYDSSGAGKNPGNLLGHTGALAATTGLFTKNLTANLPLSPGQYWLAFIDTAADQYWSASQSTAGIVTAMKTTSTALTVLPATIGAIADYNVSPALCGLILNGWS